MFGEIMRKDNYIDINKSTYDQVASELLDRHKYLRVNEPTPENYYDKVMKYIKNSNSLKYLELGPGDGYVLSFFADKGIETHAIEISGEMSKICKKKSPNTELINDNILNVNYENNKFDIIFAGSFIHLFNKDDLAIIMNKIYDWLDKEGIFFAYTTKHEIDEEGFFSKEKTNYKKENVRFRHNFTRESLDNLLEEHNFKILEHYEISEPENNRIWQFIIGCK